MDARAIAFLGGCDALIVVVGGEQDDDGDGINNNDNNDNSISHQDRVETDHSAIGRDTVKQFQMLSEWIPSRARQQRKISPVASKVKTDARKVPVVIADSDSESIGATLRKVGLEKHEPLVGEWMAAKIDVNSLSGLNQALLWIIDRTR